MKVYKITQNFGPFDGYLVYEDTKSFYALSDKMKEFNALCVTKGGMEAEDILLSLAAYQSILNPDEPTCKCYQRKGHPHGIKSTNCRRCDLPIGIWNSEKV